MSLANKPINAILSQRDQELYFERQEGLTLLEYYAGKAMQGLIASENENYCFGDEKKLAQAAIAQAKALIAELEKQQ